MVKLNTQTKLHVFIGPVFEITLAIIYLFVMFFLLKQLVDNNTATFIQQTLDGIPTHKAMYIFG